MKGAIYHCRMLEQVIIDHIHKPDTYGSILFIDYSSAFKTIIPSVLLGKLREIEVEIRLYNIITAFLSDRTQLLRPRILTNQH